jgi:hypothetical protein
MIVEGFRRRTERQKAEEYEQKPEAVPPSVAEILANPAYSELLKLALQKETNPKKKDLLTKILERQPLENQDFKQLENYRQLIKEATEYSREITQRLTPETIKIIAGASPEFRKLVAQIGINNINDFLEAYLARLYLIDKTKFSALAEKVEAIKEAEQKFQDIDNSLRESCRKYGISESELAQIYERGGSDKEIQTLVYERLNLLERIKNLLKGGKLIEERVGELNKIKNIQEKIEELHENLAEIGKMIANAVFKTQEGRTFLTKALYGQIEKLGGGLSFREAASFYSKDLEREWEEYKREVTEEEGGKFQGQNPDDENVQAQLREEFVKHLRQKRFKNKMGGVIDVLMGMVANWLANK